MDMWTHWGTGSPFSIRGVEVSPAQAVPSAVRALPCVALFATEAVPAGAEITEARGEQRRVLEIVSFVTRELVPKRVLGSKRP